VAQEKYKDWTFDYGHFDYIWIPGYGEKYKPPMPCDMWQYTSKGALPGVNGNVDLNKLMGTKPLSFFTGVDGAGEQGEDSATDDTDGGESQMFTGKELAAYCETMYANKAHWAYWYGTYGNVCTMKKYESKKKQYPEHYGSSRTKGYMKDIEQGRRCADCVGMIKSFFWTGNRYNTDPKYGTNGCPDKSANGLFDMCKETGDIKTIPDIPGIVVWKSGHIGVYVGNGYTVEMKGFAQGHYIEFLDAIEGKGPYYEQTHSRCFSDVEYCVPQMEGILVGCVAQRLPGKKLNWNSAKQSFDLAAANAFVKPFIRDGFGF
jgi:hypothetical protein